MPDQNTMFKLTVTPRLKEILATVITWARIIAVVSFISIPFEFYASMKDKELLTGIMNAVITFILNLYLLNFSAKVKRGLEASDQFEFNDGIAELRKYFRLLGIFIILLIAVVVLMMFWALSTGSYRGF